MAGIALSNSAAAAKVTLATATPDQLYHMSTTVYTQFLHNEQLFMYVIAFDVFCIAFLFFMFKPFIPFVISKIWTHTPVVGVMNRVRNIAPFGGMQLRNGMYRWERNDNVMYFVKKYFGSYFFGGVTFDIVHRDRGFVQDPIANKYIALLYAMGYKDRRDLKNALMFNRIDPEGEHTGEIVSDLGFDSYESARKLLNPSDLVPTSLLYVPKYSSIPFDVLIGWGSNVAPGSIAAVVSHLYEMRKPPEEENIWKDILPFVPIFLSIAIGAIMIISVMR